MRCGRPKELEACCSSLDPLRWPGRAHRAARRPGGRRPSASRLLLDPTSELRVSFRPASEPVDLARCLQILCTRLEQSGRLAVEHERVSIVGDRGCAERRDIERVADVGQADQLHRPPERRACQNRQQHGDQAQNPPPGLRDRSDNQERCRKATAQDGNPRHLRDSRRPVIPKEVSSVFCPVHTVNDVCRRRDAGGAAIWLPGPLSFYGDFSTAGPVGGCRGSTCEGTGADTGGTLRRIIRLSDGLLSASVSGRPRSDSS